MIDFDDKNYDHVYDDHIEEEEEFDTYADDLKNPYGELNC